MLVWYCINLAKLQWCFAESLSLCNSKSELATKESYMGLSKQKQAGAVMFWKSSWWRQWERCQPIFSLSLLLDSLSSGLLVWLSSSNPGIWSGQMQKPSLFVLLGDPTLAGGHAGFRRAVCWLHSDSLTPLFRFLLLQLSLKFYRILSLQYLLYFIILVMT